MDSRFVRQFLALSAKKWHLAHRDIKFIASGLLFPLVAMTLLIIITSLTKSSATPPTSIPSSSVDLSSFPGSLLYDTDANSTDSPGEVNGTGVLGASTFKDLVNAPISDGYLLNDTRYAFGGVYFTDIDYTSHIFTVEFWYNASLVQHALPAMVQDISQAILRVVSGNANAVLNETNAPLAPLLPADFVPAFLFFGPILMEYGFAFMIPLFAVQMIRENELKQKQQLMLNSVPRATYWVAAFIGDYVMCADHHIKYLVPTTITIIGLHIAKIDPISRNTPLAAILLLFLFGLTAISLAYCISHLFEKQETANKWLFSLISFLVVIPYLLVQIAFHGKVPNGVQYALCLFPPYCLYHGMYLLCQALLAPHPLTLSTLFTSAHGLGVIYSILVLEALIFLALAIYIDVGLQRGFCKMSASESVELGSSHLTAEVPHDTDVEEEAQRVIRTGDDMVRILRIRKSFQENGRTKQALNGVTVGIPSGECFGLLGPNGAGKTTLLSILCGLMKPDGGEAYVAGVDILRSMQDAYGEMGFCPQFEVLWDLLTGEEHLQLFGRIKGLSGDRLHREVDRFVLEFDLESHRHKQAHTYSGGTKRKLSVALALIGDPRIVFLDEPSTGMDPVVRRQLWDIILRMRGGRAMILTTHSMEEAVSPHNVAAKLHLMLFLDALCTRIGIMISGSLRCLGSSQHLKNKYGSGYTLSVKCGLEAGDNAHNAILRAMPFATFANEMAHCRNYQIPQDSANLSKIFSTMADLAADPTLQITDYSATQATLEQVFLRFASAQDKEED